MQAGQTVAFHCCQVNNIDQKGDQLKSVLSHVAVQLLKTMPNTLDSMPTRSIRRKTDSLQWGKDARLAIDVIAEILSNLERATIIIGKVDLMRGDWKDPVSMLL